MSLRDFLFRERFSRWDAMSIALGVHIMATSDFWRGLAFVMVAVFVGCMMEPTK